MPTMTTPSAASAQYQNIKHVSHCLKEAKCVDTTLKLSSEISLKTLPPFTPKQKQLLAELLQRKFFVRSKENDLLFSVSIQELLNEIERIAAKLNLVIKDICLVGSGAQSILESDPAYFSLLDRHLCPNTPDAPFSSFPFTPNDYDIRVYFQDANEEQRYHVSEQLLGYYTELMKLQSCDLLADKVTETYLNYIRPILVRSLKDKIQEHIRAGHLHSHIQKIVSSIVSANYFSETNKFQVLNAISSQLIECQINKLRSRIRLEILNSLSNGQITDLSKTLSTFALLIPKNTAFKKLSNQKDHIFVVSPKHPLGPKERILNPNRYFIHSLHGGIELMGILDLERSSQLSPDAPQISLRTQELAQTPECAQGAVDRRLKLTRVIQKTTYAIDYLKHCINLTLGLDAAAQSDEKHLIQAFITQIDNPSEIKKFREYVELQSKKDPVYYLMFLFNCCHLLAEKPLIFRFLELCQKVKYEKGTIEYSLISLLFSSKLQMDKIRHVLTVLGMIYLRNKQGNNNVEYILRTDLNEPVLKLALNCQKRPYFLPMQFSPQLSIELVCKWVSENQNFRQSFYNLYKCVLGNENHAEEIHQLLIELSYFHKTFGPSERELWSIVFSLEIPISSSQKLKEEAEERGFFDSFTIEEAHIWKNAPLSKRKEMTLNYIKNVNLTAAWACVEKDPEVIQVLYDEIITAKKTVNLSWNLLKFAAYAHLLHPQQIFTVCSLVLKHHVNTSNNGTLLVAWMEYILNHHQRLNKNKLLNFLLEEFSNVRFDSGVPEPLKTTLSNFIPSALEDLRLARNVDSLRKLFEMCLLQRIPIVTGFLVLRAKCLSMQIIAGQNYDGYKLLKYIAAQSKVLDSLKNDELALYKHDLLALFENLFSHNFECAKELFHALVKYDDLKSQLCEKILNKLTSILNSKNYSLLERVLLAFPEIKDRSTAKSIAQELKNICFNSLIFPKDKLESLCALYPELSPQNWHSYWKQRHVQSNRYNLNNFDTQLSNQWNTIFWDKNFWFQQNNLHLQTLLLAIDCLKESELIQQIAHFSKFKELFPENFNAIINKILKRICVRNCSAELLPQFKELRNLVVDNAEQWVEIDVWFVNQYLLKNQSELACQMLIRILKLHPGQTPQSLYVKIVNSSLKPPIQCLEELYRLAETTWAGNYIPSFIVSLRNSEQPLHKEIVQTQYVRMHENPARALEIPIDVLNNHLVELLQKNPVEATFSTVNKIFSVPELRNREELALAALEYHDQNWSKYKNILIGIDPGFQKDKYSEFLKNLPCSIFLREIYWRGIEFLFKALFHHKKFFHAMVVYNEVMKAFKDNLTNQFSLGLKDLFVKSGAIDKHYHYNPERINLHVNAVIFDPRCNPRIMPYLQEIMKFHISFFEYLTTFVASQEIIDEDNAPVLDLGFVTLSLIINGLRNQGYSHKFDITPFLARFNYQFKDISSELFGKHIEKSWSFISLVQAEKIEFNKAKVQELIFYDACVVAVEKDPKSAFIVNDKEQLVALRNVLKCLKARNNIHSLAYLMSIFIRLYNDGKDTPLSYNAFLCFDIVADLYKTKFDVMSRYRENPYYQFFWFQLIDGERFKDSPIPECILDTLEFLVKTYPEMAYNNISISLVYLTWVENFLKVFCEKYDLSAVLLFDRAFDVIAQRVLRCADYEEKFNILTAYSELICSHSIVISEECRKTRCQMIIQFCKEVAIRFPDKKFMDSFILKIFKRGYNRGFEPEIKELLHFLLEKKAYSGMELLFTQK